MSAIRTYRDSATKEQKFEIDLTDASGGINDRDDSREIADNESVLERNVLTSRKGSARKRYGYDRVSVGSESGAPRGMIMYVRTGFTTQRVLLIFQNGKVWYVRPDDFTWVAVGSYGDNKNRTVRGEVFGNEAIFGNAADATQKVAYQSVYTGGVSVTDLTTWQALTTGSFRIVIGGITYDVTGINTSAAANNAGVAGIVQTALRAATGGTETVTHDGVGAFVITSDDEITEIGAVGSGVDISGLAGEDYLSGRDNPLVADQPSFDMNFAMSAVSGAPRTNVFGKINAMLLAALGTNAKWSEPSSSAFTGTNTGSIAVNYEDGEQLQALAEHGDAIIAFKRTSKRGLSVVFDDDNLSVGLKESNIVDKFGTIAGGSVVPVDGGGMMYLSESGFRSYGIQENYALQRTSAGLSRKIKRLIKRINRQATERVTGIHHEDFVFFAVPLDTSGVNNGLIVYDLEFLGWTLWDIPAAAFAYFQDALGRDELYFVHSYEPALCKLNREFVDDVGGGNAPIVFEREWKHFSPFASCFWKEIEVQMKITAPSQTEIRIETDGKVWSQTITEADIKGEQLLFEGYGGDVEWGEEAWGGDVDLLAGPKMFDVVIKRDIDKRANVGAECHVYIKNDRVNEGIDVRRVVLRGTPLHFSE